MGVRYLLSYARAHLQRLVTFEFVSPPEKRQYIVLDVLGLSKRYLGENFFADLHFMRNRVLKDVEAFRRAGFELIVTIDGSRSDENMEHWFTRRETDVARLKNINKYLESKDSHCVLTGNEWRPCVSVSNYLGQAFRNAGCQVHYSVYEVDHETAWLAIKHDAYGVCSMDSDYLVYPKIKRYLIAETLEIDEDHHVRVGIIEKSYLARYIGLSEELLPAMAGILGNDLLPTNNLNILKQKWRLEWKPEMAAAEISRRKQQDWPYECFEALRYYQPVEPKIMALPDEPVLEFIIRTSKKLCRGIYVESLKERSCHEVLAPLRKAAYAKLGAKCMVEYICDPRVSPKDWRIPRVIQTDENTPIMPTPPGDMVKAVESLCTYLHLIGELEEFYFKAFIAQIKHRNILKEKLRNVEIRKPGMKDVHVVCVYLAAIDFYWLGSKTTPYCWDLFDGRLFHALCQNRDAVEEYNISINEIISVSQNDWTEVLKSNLGEVYQNPKEQIN